MKNLLLLIAAVGTIAFIMSFVIRVLNTGPILKASASGWWRGSIGLLAIGILVALIELVRQQSPSS